MLVSFYATLRRVVGAKSVDFDLPAGATVQGLIDAMIAQYPDLRQELLDENGDMYQHVHIFINGRDAPFLEEGLNSRLSPEDTIGVFPAVGGG